jgi:hypothetical protein
LANGEALDKVKLGETTEERLRQQVILVLTHGDGEIFLQIPDDHPGPGNNSHLTWVAIVTGMTQV